MEPFELIRLNAASLHDEVVAAGADPTDTLALVSAAAVKLELELIWLPEDDPVLKGAKGLFDEQTGTICCAAIEPIEARACLAAHEIGHARLHPTSADCGPGDIDITQSTESAPVGLQRVEDYGAHERREQQANVFAREFLLPRAYAQTLHMREQLGASNIAERLALPIDLVRQQLLDALLLPVAPDLDDDAEPVMVTRQKDESQERAAAHEGTPFLLQAGPGTGKTRTLVKRARRLLESGVDPASILLLTFSNRAAGELAERIAAAVPKSAAKIWIGTFHAFGLDLIKRYHDQLDLPSKPDLFDRSDAIEVLEELLPTLPLKHYRNLWDPAMVLRDIVVAISRAKDEMTSPEQYRALAQSMLDAAADEEAQVVAEKALEVADVYELYEVALRDRRAVDFGDIVMRPTLLLEQNAALRHSVQLRHRHLLVDEYQDVNRASARLLKTIAGDGKRLWVVGDSRQSIYRFRGASAANMESFDDDYPGAKIDRLEVNYRSSAEIVDTFEAVAPHMGASEKMLALNLSPSRGTIGIRPQLRRFVTLDNELEGLSASITELVTQGVAFRDQAVLCRSNKRLNEVANALESQGIPVLHLGSLFERDEIRDLLALLSLAVDPLGSGVVRLAASARYAIPLQDTYLITQSIRSSSDSVHDSFARLASDGSLTAQGVQGLTLLTADLAALNGNGSAWAYLTTYLLDRTDLIADLARENTTSATMRGIAIWQFLNFVRAQSPIKSGRPIARTLERVRQLVLLAEERDLRQIPASALHIDAVRLMTVHGSKGLEFPAVHIPGLTVASFPTSNRGQRCPPPVGMVAGAKHLSVKALAKLAHTDEEECLFFVGVSRARSHLRIYHAEKQPNGGNRGASPFLDWLPSATVERVVAPARTPLPEDARSKDFIATSYQTDHAVSASALVSYEKCPRRYFYTHVLRLVGARNNTAFDRTHNCIYALITWLSNTRLSGPVDLEAVQSQFDDIWHTGGPVDHAFADDYRRLADQLVESLFQLGVNRVLQKTGMLAIDFPNGRVVVRPDEIENRADGTVAIRKIRTGRKRSKEYDLLEYALQHLAAEAAYGSQFVLEALHLTDATVENVSISPTKIENRRKKSDDMLKGIGEGFFPPDIDAVVCPRCPHFFICAASPQGPLVLP